MPFPTDGRLKKLIFRLSLVYAHTSNKMVCDNTQYTLLRLEKAISAQSLMSNYRFTKLTMNTIEENSFSETEENTCT
jgi:hypothetical protein